MLENGEQKVRYSRGNHRNHSERHSLMIVIVLFASSCALALSEGHQHPSTIPRNVVETSTSSMWDIPFPAVTVCPETKSVKRELNFTELYHKFTNGRGDETTLLEFQRMTAMLQVCDAHLSDDFVLENTDHSIDIMQTLREMAPTFDKTMFFCKFNNVFQDCRNMYTETMTEEGLCFTFNDLSPHELFNDNISSDFLAYNHNASAHNWTLQHGYAPSASTTPQNTYPHRSLAAGARYGMFAVLSAFRQNLEYVCRGPVQGFKVALHTPGEVPQPSQHYFRVPLGQEVLVAVRPTLRQTSANLLRYAPHERQCFRDNEGGLQFFRQYTQRNCELECLANRTLEVCGCVKFGMPRGQNTRVCGAAHIKCYNDAENEFHAQRRIQIPSGGDRSQNVCNCLPSCTTITYDVEISQARFDQDELFAAFNSSIEDEYSGMMTSRLSIFIKEERIINTLRS